tara:strand:+ start:681 stop:812 length:132 start_codon:yes stop_codon:yes gene_type:complete
MGANKRYFNNIRDYFSQKYSFVEEEILWETLDTDKTDNKDEKV